MYTGTISFKGADKKFLEELGVVLVRHLASSVALFMIDNFTYEVRVSDEVMYKLDPHWGRFIWILDKESV